MDHFKGEPPTGFVFSIRFFKNRDGGDDRGDDGGPDDVPIGIPRLVITETDETRLARLGKSSNIKKTLLEVIEGCDAIVKRRKVVKQEVVLD